MIQSDIGIDDYETFDIVNNNNFGTARNKTGFFTWAAIFYLLVCLFGWLIQRRWGLFLILTLLGIVGWAVTFSYIFYYTTDADYSGMVMAISTPLGAITALYVMVNGGLIGKPTRKRRRSKTFVRRVRDVAPRN